MCYKRKRWQLLFSPFTLTPILTYQGGTTLLIIVLQYSIPVTSQEGRLFSQSSQHMLSRGWPSDRIISTSIRCISNEKRILNWLRKPIWIYQTTNFYRFYHFVLIRLFKCQSVINHKFEERHITPLSQCKFLQAPLQRKRVVLEHQPLWSLAWLCSRFF